MPYFWVAGMPEILLFVQSIGHALLLSWAKAGDLNPGGSSCPWPIATKTNTPPSMKPALTAPDGSFKIPLKGPLTSHKRATFFSALVSSALAANISTVSTLTSLSNGAYMHGQSGMYRSSEGANKGRITINTWYYFFGPYGVFLRVLFPGKKKKKMFFFFFSFFFFCSVLTEAPRLWKRLERSKTIVPNPLRCYLSERSFFKASAKKMYPHGVARIRFYKRLVSARQQKKTCGPLLTFA